MIRIFIFAMLCAFGASSFAAQPPITKDDCADMFIRHRDRDVQVFDVLLHENQPKEVGTSGDFDIFLKAEILGRPELRYALDFRKYKRDKLREMFIDMKRESPLTTQLPFERMYLKFKLPVRSFAPRPCKSRPECLAIIKDTVLGLRLNFSEGLVPGRDEDPIVWRQYRLEIQPSKVNPLQLELQLIFVRRYSIFQAQIIDVSDAAVAP